MTLTLDKPQTLANLIMLAPLALYGLGWLGFEWAALIYLYSITIATGDTQHR